MGYIRTGRGGEKDEIESLGQSRRREDVRLCQDATNVAMQVKPHRTQGTQKIRRLRQDAIPTDQTQDPFLLMFSREGPRLASIE